MKPTSVLATISDNFDKHKLFREIDLHHFSDQIVYVLSNYNLTFLLQNGSFGHWDGFVIFKTIVSKLLKILCYIINSDNSSISTVWKFQDFRGIHILCEITF